MRAAADEINSINIFEPIVRSHVQHLVEAVREIECSPFVDLVLLIPIGRRDDALVADPALDIDKTSFRYLSKYSIPETIAFLTPVHVRILMRDRDENVKSAAAFGRKRRIGDAGVLDIERRIITQNLSGFDFFYVLRVVFGNVDRVMRQIESAVDAEIEHEGRTREFLFRDLLVTPSAPAMVGNQPLHGTRKVAIDNDRIREIST